MPTTGVDSRLPIAPAGMGEAGLVGEEASSDGIWLQAKLMLADSAHQVPELQFAGILHQRKAVNDNANGKEGQTCSCEVQKIRKHFVPGSG
jgi:hypothetical protein